MKVCVEIILSYFLLLNIVAVQGTGKVQINYYKYDTKGVDYYGDSCDWYSRNCEIYLYLKYRECYSSLSSCSSYNSYYYYAGDNAKILNIIRTYSTSNTFSGRVQTQVDTYDDDGGWSNDDGLVTYTLSLTFRYASTSWSTYRSTFLGTGAYFEWKYRFYCDSYYYSNLCSIYCKARDDSSGHYTCGSSGTKNCSSGWGGTDCKYDVNKCTDGSHTCNSYSEYCSNVGNGGGYTCECLTGYTKSGSYCVNINECSSGTDGCSHYCYDTYGSYTCGCSSGYYLSGKNCYDTNECTANTDGCHHTCYNTAGSYYCDCNSGYTLSSNGKTCNDVNECSSNTDNCAQICYNTVGSFTCDCNSGYTLNSGRYCFDINECLTNNGGCAHTCTNTYGSFTCSCNTGYYLSTDTTSCMDTNECSVSNGGCGHVCTNSVDSFTCSCFSGYYLSSNERSCYDINECTQSHGCDHSCQNSAGSYSCQCSTGYTLASDGRHCDDIDECSQSNCDNQCTNIVGSYICSCIDGYSLDVDGRTCIDVDECAEDATLCPSPKICINQLGSYECGCISGYQLLQSPERCEDINECTTGTDLCEQICTNLVGSYDCGCNTNYYLHNTYSCDIILFTVTIVSSQVTSSGADIYLSTQFIPSTASVSVTYQIHTLDVSFGNGNYEVAPPTSDYSPISFSNLKPYRYYRCYVTATGTFYSVDSGYLTIRTLESYPSAPPKNLRLTALSSNSIRVEWSAPPLSECNGEITGYSIEFKKREDAAYITLFETLTSNTMSNLNEFTEYQVRVAASTAVGFGPFTIPLSVSTNQALPISPPIVEVTNIEAQSINITLTPPSIDEANGKLTEYQVVYYGEEFSQYSSLDVSPGIIWNNSIEVQLTQLEESVVYHVKARIWNAIGAGPFSSEIIRQTNPAPPSAAPRSITFSSVQPTSLSLDWIPPPEKEQNSNSTSYKVQYYGEGFDSVVRTVTTSSTRIQLTGLQEGEVYIVSVCSYNNLGGGPCEIVQQRTLEEKPSAPPQSVTAVALYDTAIRVSWYSVVESGSNGFILGYEVSINGTHHDGHSYLYSTNRTVLIVTALEEHELYSVQVRALNSIGAGPYSDVVDVMTHQDVPAGAPRELEGTPATTSISLTWSSPLAVDINGVVTAYEVHYVGTFEDVRNRTVSTSNTVYTLEQLHADETYLIQVRAYTTKGPGPYSTWIAVTSLEVAPSTHPRGVSTVAHSSTEIDVVWMPPDKSSQNGVITEYVVQISALTRNYSIKFSVSETTFLYTFTDLHPYQEYNVSVAAATQAGVGPFSTPLVEQSLQDIPRAAPSSLALRNVTARSVTINWVPVSIDDINGILIHYELELSSSHATIKIEPELISYTILGLTPNRDYSVRIAAETPPGTGPYSSLLNFTTGQEAPSVGPVINSIQSITSTTFMIMWSSTTDTVRNGAITGYEIAVTNVLTGIKAYDRTTDANNAMMEVTGLNEYTQYRVSIIAINSAGYSPSTTVSIETAQSKPSGPPQYVYPIFNSTWIELSWFSPTLPDRNGIIIGYDILVNQRVYFSNSTQFVVQHLEEALQYTIQVRAITIIGSGPYSTAINVTTLATSPSAPPQNVNATAISSEEILVTWDPIPFLEQNGHILQYTVYYWFYTVPGVKREIISTNVSMQVTISSLLAYTNYSVVVVASNAVGTSPQSETASIRTLEDIPSAAPGNLTVHILTHSSLTLVWNTIPSRDENGVIIHQTITYQAFTIDTEEQNININSEWTNFTLTNFLPSLTYQISIHASTSIGNGPRSYVNVTMPESTPSAAPVNVMIYNILTGFRVEWDELSLENRNGEITLYQILLTDISNDTTQETFQEYNTTIPEMKLTNLTDFTGYTIAIRAMTSAGYGPFSEALEALTAPDGLECFGYFSRYEREPCSNGAVCKAKGTDDFTCDCVAGYDGVICQNEIDECQTASCQSGNCVDRINNFTCVCFEGYTGRFCEVEIDLCESNPCQNTGSCVPHVNSFECICTSDYVGTVCEFPNRCLETPCKHGHCTPTGENYTCECEIGFSGHDCEYNINNCEGVLCEHGGECLDGVAKFDCACLPGFKGRYCQYTNEELTCESETIWKIIWPATKYSRTAIMPCQYIDPSFVERNATRICYKNGEWGKVNMDDCIRTQFDILSDHLTRYYDIHSPSTQGSINVTELVQNTAFVVYGRVILSPAEIRLTLNLTAFSLNSILNIDDSAKRSYLTSLNEKFICIFSAILSDQNTEYFTHEYQNMATNLLSTLQIFAELNAEAYVKTNDKPCIYIASDNIQLFVREIGSKHNVTDSKVIFNCKQNYQVLEENVLSLPSSLTDVLQDNSKLRMSVAYSKNLGKILTQTSDGIYSDSFPASTLAMIELAIDLPDQLKNTIHIQFSLLDDQTIKYGGLHCVYWNETLHGWSTSGLNVFETTNKSVTCSSNHISTFMILTESITVVDPLQNIINYVIFAIAGISLFCLISAIIFFTLLGRKLIDNDIYIAQYSLCISLILSMLTHVIGMLKYPPIQDYCHVVAVIVYLFSVTSTTCFLAEGATICFKFILPKVKRRIYILSFILGWVCPVPITVFRVVFDLNNLGVRNEYCWLASQSSTIWSMIEPILVIFFITLITVLLSLVMCCFSRNIGLVHIAKLALKTHIIFIPFILTPWIVNIVNIYVSVPYYTWVYIGVISFQGILFLPLYALCNKSIRNKLCFSKKDQEAVNDEDLPSPYSVNTPIFNMEFANPLDTANDVDKLQDGAIPYLEDKLLFGDMKDGHITPAHENEYAELELSGFIEASSVQCDDTIIQEQNKSAIENIYTGVEARAEEKSEPDS